MLNPVYPGKHNAEQQGQMEKNLMFDFQVGDKVIHYNYGLGEIVRMDDKFIHERQMKCYVVRIGDITIWVTADVPGKSSIRPPTPGVDFENLFAILRSPGEPLPVDRFERKINLVERMKDGQLASICCVIRDLVVYHRGNRFNEYDKFTLDRARKFLLTEWMYALAVSQGQANEKLSELLGTI